MVYLARAQQFLTRLPYVLYHRNIRSGRNSSRVNLTSFRMLCPRSSLELQDCRKGKYNHPINPLVIMNPKYRNNVLPYLVRDIEVLQTDRYVGKSIIQRH